MLACSSWNESAYEFALENQAGQGLRFEDPQDRKALVMGLALHEQGKKSLNKVTSNHPCLHIPKPPSPPPPSPPFSLAGFPLLGLALFKQGKHSMSRAMSRWRSESSKALTRSALLQLL